MHIDICITYVCDLYFAIYAYIKRTPILIFM